MNKEEYRLMTIKEKGRPTVKEKIDVLKVYKNGNYRIKGQRSISPGNWNRKRSMLLHHVEVRAFRDFKSYEDKSYLEVTRLLKTARKKDDLFFSIVLRGS